MPEPGVTDYRFLLANERTFLAYVRTALSLQIAGLGVLQFLTQGPELLSRLLGVSLVAVGSYVGAAGYLRCTRAERDIRAGRDLATTHLRPVTAAVIVTVPLLVGVLLVLT
jgi:putative membrane protein